MNNKITVYKGHRFSAAVISHTLWLYYRFSLSYRKVDVSYESIRKLFRKTGVRPHKVVTDKLRSYRAALKELSTGVPHATDRYQNNRADLSHQPTRQRERKMRRFKSQRQAQQFLSFHGLVSNFFRHQSHLLSA